MRLLFKFLLRLAHCSSGSAMVEMAIVTPVAISLLAGGVDFGMALSTQATGSKSVRGAARYLANSNVGCPLPSWAVQNAQNLAVFGKLSPGAGDSALIPGWQPLDVRPTCDPTLGCTSAPPPAHPITVTATFPYSSLILATFLPIASTYTLRTQHQECQVGG
jgi:TadE-like protein